MHYRRFRSYILRAWLPNEYFARSATTRLLIANTNTKPVRLSCGVILLLELLTIEYWRKGELTIRLRGGVKACTRQRKVDFDRVRHFLFRKR